MTEDWLYQITLNQIANLHNLSLTKILDFGQKIKLSTPANTGTADIQIDVIAQDKIQKILVLSECKEFLSLQAVSECSEQLLMKTYLLKKYPPTNAIGKNGFHISSLNGYRFLQYISLGSYSGLKYKNAKCSIENELRNRLDFYTMYLSYANKCDIGLLLFRDKDNPPISKIGTLKYW